MTDGQSVYFKKPLSAKILIVTFQRLETLGIWE